MEQKIREIIRMVSDIGEKISRLEGEASIPPIEKDIILGDVRALYERVRDLRESAAQAASDETRTVDADRPAQAGADGTEPQAAGNKAGQSPAGQKGKTAKTVEGRSGEPATLADKYRGDKKFINESLAGDRKTQDVSSKIQSKPIRNIGSALGINDRFKLINELFKGDKESFQKTIDILDGASNFNEAFSYINSSFDWDMEDESVQLLLDLVRRKFIVNGNE